MPKLIVTDEKGESSEHTVGGDPVTVGRSSTCDIQLSGDRVGRLHAVVEKAGKKLVVRDQESSHGTWVKGARIEEAELDAGDEFRIGGYTFKVELDAPREAAQGGARKASKDGVEAEGDGERPARRRPQREILGGAKLSKMQQTLVKIVCAAIIVMCYVFIIYGPSCFRDRQPVQVNTVTYVDPQDEPRRLKGEAEGFFKQAHQAEEAGNTAEAYRLIKEARDRVEAAQKLTDDLNQQYQSPGYARIARFGAEVNQLAATIRQEVFRIKMQVERDAGGAP